MGAVPLRPRLHARRQRGERLHGLPLHRLHARVAAGTLAGARRQSYWDYQLVQNYIYPRATFGEEPWASRLRAAPDALIPMFRREDIHALVVGGETNGYWRIMGCAYQKTVSVDDWR